MYIQGEMSTYRLNTRLHWEAGLSYFMHSHSTEQAETWHAKGWPQIIGPHS